MQKLIARGHRFVDEQGREHILHGVNVKCGTYAEKHLGWLDEAFFLQCRQAGFRLLRLGVCWETLEPEKGRYNEPVLRKMDQAFALAAQYDVMILLDLHQDLYSSFGMACTKNGKWAVEEEDKEAGNGMPLWACLSDGYQAKPEKFIWAEGYLWGKAVQHSFSNFWNDAPVLGKGLQAHYAEVWQMLARRYGESPALFGYDLMNEPHPGRPGGKIFRKLIAKLIRVCAVSPSVRRVWFLKSILSKDLQTRGHALDVLTPAVMKKITSAANALVRRFDEAYYTPFVARMTQAIRAVTQNGIILMEHSYFSNLGIPFCAKAPAGEGVCYSPHAYDFTVDTEAYAFASNERLRFIFGESRRAQGRLNVPVLVGEWGGGGKGETFFPHIEYLMNLFDSYGWSNAYFAYKPGFFETPLMRVVSRPYPMAVGGALERFQIDLKAKTATLWYHPQGGLWTELYLPRGYASVDAGEGAEVLHEGNVLKIRGGGNRIAVKYK